MSVNQIRLKLVNKMIELREEKLRSARAEVAAIEGELDKLHNRRATIEREEAFTERDTAELVKPQPAGVRIGRIEL